MSRPHPHGKVDGSPEQASFEIDALAIVRAADADSAYDAAGELVRLAEDTDGRVHLALLDNCERGES